MRTDWAYVALCLIAPLLWGIASAWLFDWWQARRRHLPASSADDASDMYHI